MGMKGGSMGMKGGTHGHEGEGSMGMKTHLVRSAGTWGEKCCAS